MLGDSSRESPCPRAHAQQHPSRSGVSVSCGERSGCSWRTRRRAVSVRGSSWMDTAVSNRCMAVAPADKTLRRQLGSLSKCLSACLVGRIATCLCRSGVLTEYEVQLIQTPGTDTQKASQLLLTVHRKGSRACQLFFKCLAVCSPSLFERVTGCTVRAADVDHYHFEDDICSETPGAVPPYIINIHNSSLTNCIIGNNNGMCCLLSRTDDTNDTLEDMQRPEQQMAAQDPTEAPSIQVQSSHVEYVIIGDNNYMSAGSNEESAEQEERESELEDSEG